MPSSVIPYPPAPTTGNGITPHEIADPYPIPYPTEDTRIHSPITRRATHCSRN